jgi:menaquinone-dependent protoporphyrinogen IX oxidase
VLAIGGLVLFATSGGDPKASAEKVVQSNKEAGAKQGMTKAELEEQQAHLKRTQAALIAAAAEEQEEEQKNAQKEAAHRQAQQAAQESAAAAPKKAASGPAPKKPVNTKKKMDGLDALGADITSALE